MVIELVTALALLALIVGGLTVTQRAAGLANAVQLERQHCVAAAQAQLERLSAGGKPLPAAQVEDLWPGVRTRLSAAEGQGEWKGLTLVTVEAQGQTRGRPVRVELSRYYDRAPEVQP